MTDIVVVDINNKPIRVGDIVKVHCTCGCDEFETGRVTDTNVYTAHSEKGTYNVSVAVIDLLDELGPCWFNSNLIEVIETVGSYPEPTQIIEEPQWTEKYNNSLFVDRYQMPLAIGTWVRAEYEPQMYLEGPIIDRKLEKNPGWSPQGPQMYFVSMVRVAMTPFSSHWFLTYKCEAIRKGK